jgi:hypothetical protein
MQTSSASHSAIAPATAQPHAPQPVSASSASAVSSNHQASWIVRNSEANLPPVVRTSTPASATARLQAAAHPYYRPASSPVPGPDQPRPPRAAMLPAAAGPAAQTSHPQTRGLIPLSPGGVPRPVNSGSVHVNVSNLQSQQRARPPAPAPPPPPPAPSASTGPPLNNLSPAMVSDYLGKLHAAMEVLGKDLVRVRRLQTSQVKLSGYIGTLTEL